MNPFILLLSQVVLTGTVCAQYMDQGMLESNLFNGYRVDHRPVNESSQTVMVEVELSLFKVAELDVSKEVLVTWLEFKITWTDQRLQWKEEEYPGVRTMIVSSSKVWLPDLHVIKSAYKDSKLEGQDYIQISHHGNMQWYGELETKTWCSMNVNKFPFDEHKCTISISTIYHYEKDVNITNINYNDGDVEKNGSWNIKSIAAQRETFEKRNKTKSGILIQLELHRHSNYYIYTVFMPIITVFGVNPFVFLVRAKSGEKISTAVTMFLSFTIFLSLLGDMIPQTSSSIPFIFILVYIQFQMSAAIVINCILFSRRSHVKKVKWYTKFFRFMMMCKAKRKILDVLPADTNNDAITMDNNSDDKPFDTKLLADKDDRKLFFIHFIMTLLLLVSAILYLMLKI